MINDVKSLLMKLKNKSKQNGISFQQQLQLLAQEEFLRRLSLSPYRENFILKGGLFIYILSNFKSRSTIDIDFMLQNQSNDVSHITNIISEIINLASPNDFISYKIAKTQPITLEKKYPGISITLSCMIGKTNTPLSLDLGIGDVIIPSSQIHYMKSQLTECDSVAVRTYSIESTIAEKFDAILQRFELTSRMKDFYDIYYLSSSFDFDGFSLSKAIRETLENRGTQLQTDSLKRVLALSSSTTTLSRWNVYAKKFNIPLTFEDTLARIDSFLKEPINNILLSEHSNKKWISTDLQWI